MSARGAGLHVVSVERPPILDASPLARLASGIAANAQAELRKLRRDFLDVITRSAQPLLWLFIFGTALRDTRTLTVGDVDYRTFLAPGVMAQGALFISIFFGLVIIWERDVGQMQRLLATPVPRAAIIIGKATGAGVRAFAQALVLLTVIALAGIELDWAVLNVLGALVLLLIGAGAFACFSVLLAAILKTRERFMGIGQLTIMPLFFASSALYPLSVMPDWLEVIAHANPITYQVEGLRELLLGIDGSVPLWADYLAVGVFFAAMVALATRMYPRAIL